MVNKGLFYNCKESKNIKITYRCNFRNCKYNIYTNICYNLINITEHNHLAYFKNFTGVILKQKIKSKILTINKKLRNIIFSAVNKIRNHAGILMKQNLSLI